MFAMPHTLGDLFVHDRTTRDRTTLEPESSGPSASAWDGSRPQDTGQSQPTAPEKSARKGAGGLTNQYEALLRTSRAISSYREPTALFRALARELKSAVKFDFIGLFLYNESLNKIEMPVLEVVSGAGLALPEDLPTEETITWWVYHNQKPVVIASPTEETRFARVMKLYRDSGVQSGVVLPLTTAHRRLGGLAFGSEQASAYSEEHVKYLSIVADHVALAVDNALRDEEQRRGEMFLAEGERLSRTGSWLWRPSKNELHWSQQHYRLFGLDPTETKPSIELFWKHVHPDDRTTIEQTVNRAIREKRDFEHEFRVIATDGSIKHVHGIGHAIVSKSGELIEFIGTTMDITDRRRIEEDLRIQKAHFERLFELAPEAIVLRDIDNRILRVNKEFTKLFGYTVDEAVGKNVNSLIVPDELCCESEELRDALRRGERINADLIRSRKDGTRLNVSFVAAAVKSGGSDPEIYGIYRDITGRKQAEEKLRRSEAYLAEGQKLTHTGSWARSVPSGELYWSQESLRIFGFDLENPRTTVEAFLNRVHPEDRASVLHTIEDSILHRADFERDYRIVLNDGAVRYIHVIGHPVIDASGILTEFVGTHVDVTEQRESSEALEKAFEEIKQLKDQLYQENLALREEIDETSMFEEIIGKSAALRKVLAQVETVAATDSTVIIYGETGTGKELIARAIHNLGGRASQAFVKLNCAAIPTGLLESELFGHEKGAFTGAIAQRIGRFELANHGTVFLDEIGEISLELQPKLLRVLQEREFERLGSSRTLRTNARLIAATNRDLSAMVAEQKFRSDLFYRLEVFPIHVPPLRDRKEDIPLLVRHFVQLYSRQLGKSIDSVPAATMTALCEYQWPGNIRELQNVIERAVIVSTGFLNVNIGDLKPNHVFPAPTGQPAVVPTTDAQRARRAVDEKERQEILAVLEQTHWTVGGPDGAAARLGIKRSTLQYRMRRLGIPSRRATS
jgi:PAS domain S-box-containing protein